MPKNIAGFLRPLLLVIAVARVAGQGYDFTGRHSLGATQLQQQLAAISRRAYTFTQQWKAGSRTSCAGKTAAGSSADLCAAAANKDYQAYMSLLQATSPATYSSTSHSSTDGLRIVADDPGTQGACNACVAFAVVAAAQTAVAATMALDVEQVRMSVQDLNFCSPDESRMCRSGWNFAAALEQLRKRQQQLLSSKCLPYNPDFRADTAAELCSSTCKDRMVFAAKGTFRIVEISDMLDAQLHIRRHGSVMTTFQIMSDFKDFFNNPNNAKVAYSPKASARPVDGGWHAVTMVGYHNEDNSGNGYWLCQNWWGEEFTDGGYFRVKYGCCGILDEAYALQWDPKSAPSYIPTKLQPIASRPGCYLYTASQGDYLSKIAFRTGATIEQLLADNLGKLGDPVNIPAGHALTVCNLKLAAGLVPAKTSKQTANMSTGLATPVDPQAELLMATSPQYFDARSMMGGFSAVGPVKSQGDCNTVVSFVVLAAAQSAMASALHRNAQSSLSEQDFYFCRSLSIGEEISCTSSMSMRDGIERWERLGENKNFPVLDTCMPYDPENVTCSKLCTQTIPDLQKGDFKYLMLNEAWEVMDHIRTWGSAMTGLNVYTDLKPFFAAQPNGIYTGPDSVATFISRTAIQLVGYDMRSEPKYWIAKMSRGTGFADASYVRVAMGARLYDRASGIGNPEDTFGLKFILHDPSLDQFKKLKLSQQKRCYTYVSGPGDYVSKVARMFDVPIKQVLADNEHVVHDPSMFLKDISLTLCELKLPPGVTVRA